MIECPCRCVLQLSHENEHEGLLADSTVGVKEWELRVYSSSIHWRQAMQLTFWTIVWVWHGRLRVTLRQDVRWFQVRAWYDRSYIAWIPLLADGLTMKLSPCTCSHSSLAEQNSCMSVSISNAICYSLRLAPWLFSILLVRMNVKELMCTWFGKKKIACEA